MGADVTVVAGRTTERPPSGVRLIRAQSAQEMLNAVLPLYPEMDVVVKSAAVADYRPVQTYDQKIKKTGETLVLELERTTDILQTLGERKTHQLLVGFAAETQEVERYAMDKLKRKNCDLIVANDVGAEGAGFNVETNEVQIYGPQGLVEALPLMSKRETAGRIMDVVARRLGTGGGGSGS
jgi:phosphopantothenoylcysteine decarboxylase/phosphopantothenate--cysteine ligase